MWLSQKGTYGNMVIVTSVASITAYSHLHARLQEYSQLKELGGSQFFHHAPAKNFSF